MLAWLRDGLECRTREHEKQKLSPGESWKCGLQPFTGPAKRKCCLSTTRRRGKGARAPSVDDECFEPWFKTSVLTGREGGNERREEGHAWIMLMWVVTVVEKIQPGVRLHWCSWQSQITRLLSLWPYKRWQWGWTVLVTDHQRIGRCRFCIFIFKSMNTYIYITYLTITLAKLDRI